MLLCLAAGAWAQDAFPLDFSSWGASVDQTTSGVEPRDDLGEYPVGLRLPHPEVLATLDCHKLELRHRRESRALPCGRRDRG